MIKITESPRDAVQALKNFIPTEIKTEYINKLLQVGFDVIDVGSFVSSKAVPQMKDTESVLCEIDISETSSEISVIVGNVRYAQNAAEIPIVNYINYPFSISETFLKRNLNSNFSKSYRQIDEIIELSKKARKQPVISITSAFGNPYGDVWSLEILEYHIRELQKRDLNYIPLADTTAEANAERIEQVFNYVGSEFSDIEFNLHLHTRADDMNAKIKAAYKAGCRNFDTVFNGMGGCPMSGKELTANVNTADFVAWLNSKGIEHKLNYNLLLDSVETAEKIFD